MFIAPHSTLECKREGWCCRGFSACLNGELVETITGDWMVMRIHTDGVCNYLNRATWRCTIYNSRPLLCARWNCEDCKPIPN